MGSQLEGRAQQALSPMASLDSALERNTILGEVSGLTLALRYPELVIIDMKERLEEFTEEDENGN